VAISQARARDCPLPLSIERACYAGGNSCGQAVRRWERYGCRPPVAGGNLVRRCGDAVVDPLDDRAAVRVSQHLPRSPARPAESARLAHQSSRPTSLVGPWPPVSSARVAQALARRWLVTTLTAGSPAQRVCHDCRGRLRTWTRIGSMRPAVLSGLAASGVPSNPNGLSPSAVRQQQDRQRPENEA
jgi:hypothetical protein